MLWFSIFAFGNARKHVIPIRNDVVIGEIKCPIIGTVI